MAKKSKTQRAKASAARSAKKDQVLEESGEVKASSAAQPVVEEKKSLNPFKKKEEPASTQTAKKKEEAKPKKDRFKFFKEVRSEMKRVTWPTKQEVLRWSVVVVVALLFFGVYVALLDNVIITPLLIAISGLGV